ncbi:hypothetical protein K435DRAFT_751401 [Dendrothele bispora CBS 962.96]|uniref:BTB domain-containing protein n=1 Tax=Dendrothele bispora (strain CBS 962.96) TaxID=1314807 RepID=A0A4S8MCN8_DENBC|nr:hypothetical protein K435DRAFT_751401 [Dendrothele bispora CBS 962.96]
MPLQTTTPAPGVTVNVNVPNATVDVQQPARPAPRRRPSRRIVSIETRRSSRFCVDDPQADWFVLSNDGVLFGVRGANAEICGEGIYDLNSPDAADDELEWHIKMNAPARVLEILFEYLYNRRRRTDLETVSIDLLIELIDVAEEYRVRSAIDACQKALRKHITDNALKVVQVSGKHGYNDELVRAAPYVVDEDLSVIWANLPNHLHMPWAIFREKYVACYISALETYPEHPGCARWPAIVLTVLKMLRGKPRQILIDAENIFREAREQVMVQHGPTVCCVAHIRHWCQRVLTRRNAIGDLEVPA